MSTYGEMMKTALSEDAAKINLGNDFAKGVMGKMKARAKTLRATVKVPGATLDKINHYLLDEPVKESECLSEDDTITYTAVFSDGMQMDIKCCGVQFRPGEVNTAWSEAVLFNKDGCECGGSGAESDFEGDWQIEYKGILYVATVVRV